MSLPKYRNFSVAIVPSNGVILTKQDIINSLQAAIDNEWISGTWESYDVKAPYFTEVGENGAHKYHCICTRQIA